jgi:hypothetical protein
MCIIFQPRWAIIKPIAITSIPETRTICRITAGDNKLANSPKPNNGTNVPRPNINKIIAPCLGSPLPAAITYMACNGPQPSNSPVNKPVRNGLRWRRNSPATCRLTEDGKRKVKRRNQEKTFNIFRPYSNKNTLAANAAMPRISGVMAIVAPSKPKPAPSRRVGQGFAECVTHMCQQLTDFG